MNRQRVLLNPHFRRMDEIFGPAAADALHANFDVVWGRDEPMPVDAFVRELDDVDAAIFAEWPEGVDLAATGPRLRLLADVSGTLDHPGLDFDACFRRGIQVGTIAPVFGRPVAEHCLGLAISAARSISQSSEKFRDGSELYQHDGTVGCTSLYGNTVGFIGCGGLSRELQSLLRPFGCRLIGYDPWVSDEDLSARGIERCPDLGSLFDQSGVVFVLAVPTPSNRGMISGELMERLGTDDVLIVASRAHLVDFDAMTELLAAGRFRAGIDVFPTEPLRADHQIREARTAVLTAHIAGALPDDLRSIGDSVLADLNAVFSGTEPEHLQYATPSFVHGLREGVANSA